MLFRTIEFDLQAFIEIMYSIDISLFILSLAGVIIVLCLKSYRWYLMLNNEGINYSYWNSVRSYYSSYSLGIITPGRLGEMLKIYNVREKTGIHFYTPFKVTFSDRLYDMLFLLIMAFAGSFKYFYDFYGNDLIYITVAISILFCIILLTYYFLRLQYFNIGKRLRVFSTILVDLLGMLIKIDSILYILITILAYFVFYFSTWLILRSLSIDIGILDTGYIISLVGIILLIPISIAGFGTREVTVVYLLSLYGIGSEMAISFSMMHLFAYFIWGGIIGAVLFWITPISLSLIRIDTLKIIDIMSNKQRDR
jgi:glycosyltransferase 2 family protein